MASAKKSDGGREYVARNKKARHDYFIDDVVEAGIVLTGTEVKSLRQGKASLGASHAGEMKGEFYLFNAQIAEYDMAADHLQHRPRRPRKLLLHRREINRMLGMVQQKGVTVVPLSIYFTPRGIAKVELGIARGKKQYEKRETMKKRDWQRDKARIMRDKS